MLSHANPDDLHIWILVVQDQITMHPLAASLDHRFSTPFSASTTLSACEERFYSFQGSISSNRIFLNNCTIFLQNPGANRIISSITIAVTVLFIVSITQILLLK